VGGVFGNADAYAERLDELIARQPSPRWMVELAARKASIYESVWLALERMTSPLTPTQQATIDSLKASANDAAREFAEDTESRAWRPRTEAMDRAAMHAVGTYAWALAFGAEMHVRDFDDEIRTRLAIFRRRLQNVDGIIRHATAPRGMAGKMARLKPSDLSRRP
jgi:hypothetical protein